MTRRTMAGVVIGGVLLAACNTPPPRPWLRFRPAGATNWSTAADGTLRATLHGVGVTLDLGNRETKIHVMVENGTDRAIEFKMGPEGAQPRSAIGEVLLRPLAGPPGTSGPDMLPYNCMQAQSVDAAWRGTFFIDVPLGRAVTVGQTFVFTVEARDAAGAVERRSLPLVAENSGTMPADAR